MTTMTAGYYQAVPAAKRAECPFVVRRECRDAAMKNGLSPDQLTKLTNAARDRFRDTRSENAAITHAWRLARAWGKPTPPPALPAA